MCAHDGELIPGAGNVSVLKVDFSDGKIPNARHPLRFTISTLTRSTSSPPPLHCASCRRHTCQ